MGQKISAHNREIIERERDKTEESNVNVEKTPDSNCSYRKKDNCPLQGDCLTESLLYKATVDSKETYIGITGGTFKSRLAGHTASFKHREKEAETQLSKHIWRQKDKGKDPSITWECLLTAPTYNPGLGRCILCLKEKERILYHREDASLNSRSEIISHCRHKRKFLLL